MMLMLLGMAAPAMAGTWSFYGYWSWGTWSYPWYSYIYYSYTITDTGADTDTDADTDADTDTDTDVDTADTGGGKDGGCACNTGSEMGGAAGLLLAMGVIARRRRS
jgi:MYXO-CTERM domain-containing protein